MSSTGPRPHDDARALRLCVDELRAEPVPELDWGRLEQGLLDRIARREPPRYAAPRPQSSPSMLPRFFGFAAAAAVLALLLSSLKPHQVASVNAEAPRPVDVAAMRAAPDGDRDFGALAAGDAIETRDAEVTFEQARSVRWTLGPGSRAVVRAKGKGGVGHVVALERGWIRAEVTPRDPSEGMVEAFAVEADGTRVAVHGTLFKVTRLDSSIMVDVDHGAVAVGPVGHVGITTGRLLVGPARASFSLDGGKSARLMQRTSDAYAALELPEPAGDRQPALGQLAPTAPADPVEKTDLAPAPRAPAAPVAKAAPAAPVEATPEPVSEPVAAVEPPAAAPPPDAVPAPPPKYLTKAAVYAQLEQCFRKTASSTISGFEGVVTLKNDKSGSLTLNFDGSLHQGFYSCVAGALPSLGKLQREMKVPFKFTKPAAQ